MNQPTMDDLRPDSADTTRTTTTLPVVDDKPIGRRGGIGWALAAALAVLVLGFGGGVGGFYAADHWSGDDSSISSSQPSLQPSNDTSGGGTASKVSSESGTLTPGQIYARVAPAVVHITAHITTTDTSFLGIPQQEEATGTGSGFVISKEGYIVTNAHVVEDATDLSVIFGNGTPIPAKVVGLDKSTDVAVIKVDPKAKQLDGPLTTVGFADSTHVKVGDPVVAIGNPFSLDRTLTTGVVSALQRDIASLNDYKISDVIQIDAAINPGNSGGPLLNTAGKVIGINSQIQSKTGAFAGIAFAVPSDTAQQIAKQLIANGSVKHAWFGMTGVDLTEEIAEKLNLDVHDGVVVAAVTPGSPAAKAGLRGAGDDAAVIDGQTIPVGGDIVTKFDGKAVTSMRKLADTVDAKKPGDKVEIEFVHDG
ncbi:MAG: hypothetical protein JWN41_898, partial [Thermoleophilia bacterium]|nr:hypothetical protein [Thermoleophilia bacterium]